MCLIISTSALSANNNKKSMDIAPTIKDYTGKNCWLETAALYKIDPYLLFAIAMVESGLNPTAININPNGSMDYGMMQINSSWYPKLAKMGITKESLADGCVSIQVGAWVLAWNFYNIGHKWEAVGAYNANSYAKRYAYAKKVYAMYDMLNKWSTTYRDLYVKEFNSEPAYVPKPPSSWVLYAYNNSKSQ